jgi:hypothetical protein
LVDEWVDVPAQPTPLEQMRALEAPFDDDFKKILRQFLIAYLFERAKTDSRSAGMTDVQIHTALMAQSAGSGKAYAALYTLEQAIVPIRANV